MSAESARRTRQSPARSGSKKAKNSSGSRGPPAAGDKYTIVQSKHGLLLKRRQEVTMKSLSMKTEPPQANFEEKRLTNGNIPALACGPLTRPRYVNPKMELELVAFKKEVEERFARSALTSFVFPKLRVESSFDEEIEFKNVKNSYLLSKLDSYQRQQREIAAKRNQQLQASKTTFDKKLANGQHHESTNSSHRAKSGSNPRKHSNKNLLDSEPSIDKAMYATTGNVKSVYTTVHPP